MDQPLWIEIPRRARLARRLAALTEAARRKVSARERLREDAEASSSIRAALEAAIDPAQISAVRYFAAAERALSHAGDNADLRRADATFIAGDPRLAARDGLAASAAARAAQLAGAAPPDPGSPLDWYAWSLAARAGGGPHQNRRAG